MSESSLLAIRPCADGCLLRVRVKSNAAAERVIGAHGGAVKLSVKEAPEKGRANRAVCALLARLLGLPAGSVTLAAGGSSPDKTIRVAGIDPAECRRRLDPLLERGRGET